MGVGGGCRALLNAEEFMEGFPVDRVKVRARLQHAIVHGMLRVHVEPVAFQ